MRHIAQEGRCFVLSACQVSRSLFFVVSSAFLEVDLISLFFFRLALFSVRSAEGQRPPFPVSLSFSSTDSTRLPSPFPFLSCRTTPPPSPLVQTRFETPKGS